MSGAAETESTEQEQKFIGSIAQLGEHMPYKHGVTGSSPVVPTILVVKDVAR